MTTMRNRRLDENHDYTFGQGKGCYLTGVDAVAQAIETRLMLYLEEWWEDRNDGLPLWQSILGAPGGKKKIIDKLIQERILGTPNVTSISEITTTLDPDTRAYSFTCVVDTIFGSVQVSNVAGSDGSGSYVQLPGSSINVETPDGFIMEVPE
jgi:hypothetical protein